MIAGFVNFMLISFHLDASFCKQAFAAAIRRRFLFVQLVLLRTNALGIEQFCIFGKNKEITTTPKTTAAKNWARNSLIKNKESQADLS